jgi:hypothetical protein
MLTSPEVTTSSNCRASQRRLWTLFCLLVCLLAAIECLTRQMHDRRNITLTIEAGVHDALAIRHKSTQTQLLLVGNSLIAEDLSRDVMQQTLDPRFLVHAAGVHGSTYHDWQYGLRALFDRGSQPDVVIVGMSPTQFLRPAAFTPLPVSQLWGLSEVLSYYREQHPGMSVLSELLLEHYSTFFYMRDTVRLFLRKAIPGYATMVLQWASHHGYQRGGSSDELYRERLFALSSYCESHHARLIVILPPTNQVEDEEEEPALHSAAASLGVSVVEPIREREWEADKFQKDGYHLTAAAAGEFSALAAEDLSRLLSEPQPLAAAGRPIQPNRNRSFTLVVRDQIDRR